MAEQRMLMRISPDELPGLLTQLVNEQTSDFALVGPGIGLSESPDDWPKIFK
jgi:hypothetical protein